MNDNKNLIFRLIKVLGCIIFDIAIILTYLKVFALFTLVSPVKSILALFILIVGLIILNAAIIVPSMLYKRIGIPYSLATVTLPVLYFMGSNIISVAFMPGSMVWYIVWELIIFAVFLVMFSVISVFSNNVAEDNSKAEKEKNDKIIITASLLEIENILKTKENEDGISQCIKNFKMLKERIQASTPFGRISGNSAVLEIENEIKENLELIKEGLEENSVEMQKLIERTQRLAINREALIVN